MEITTLHDVLQLEITRTFTRDYERIKFWRWFGHSSFDRLWKQRLMSRKQSYERLKSFLGISEKQCHFSKFNINQCKRVIKYMEKFNGSITPVVIEDVGNTVITTIPAEETLTESTAQKKRQYKKRYRIISPKFNLLQNVCLVHNPNRVYLIIGINIRPEDQIGYECLDSNGAIEFRESFEIVPVSEENVISLRIMK
jgi:hypothetical protein